MQFHEDSPRRPHREAGVRLINRRASYFASCRVSALKLTFEEMADRVEHEPTERNCGQSPAGRARQGLVERPLVQTKSLGDFPANSLQCRGLSQTVLRSTGAENPRDCWTCSRLRSALRVPCGQGNGAELRDFLICAPSGLCKGRLGGGAGGIRTLDTLLAYTHFPGERLRPLGHRSACLWKGVPLVAGRREGKLSRRPRRFPARARRPWRGRHRRRGW